MLSITEVEQPMPAKNEILIQVYATTINRTDCANLSAEYLIMRLYLGLFKPKRPILGTDFAGEVVGVGDEVTRFKAGDRVFGFNDEGLASQAEYMTISEKAAIGIIPDGVSFHTAAASLEGPHYALNFLNKVKLQARDRVIINGATGAIGSAALQILKDKDMFVTAVANTTNLDRIKALGADEVINWEEQDFTTHQPGTYQCVCDAVGKSSFRKARELLMSGGVYVSSELGPRMSNIYYALVTPLFFRKKVKFPLPTDPQTSIDIMSKMLVEGRYDPVVDRVIPFDDAVAGYRYVSLGQKTGNVVLQVV